MCARGLLAIALALMVWGRPAMAAGQAMALKPCWLRGVEHEVLCGKLARPLDPTRADGLQIDIHVAVLPAVARNKKPDPVMFFAGGPGQSAISLAGTLSRMYERVLNRRDLILIDQRGTGESAPLACEHESPTRPLADSIDPQRQLRALNECRDQLQKLPYGDLRQFTTTIAMADADAVRRALGVDKVNLVGGSYGTRAALEYMRQFPQAVRRVVIDGVAPPDMALPASFSPDAQRAFDALLDACDGPNSDQTCRLRYPALRLQWKALLAGLPRDVVVSHPITGQDEHLVLTRDMVLGLVRLPLYSPALASALPLAISDAASGRFGALVGLAGSVAFGNKGQELALGMHFSVVCAEDMPRLGQSGEHAGADFGEAMLAVYRDACPQWPKAAVTPAFYTMPPAPAATLLLSGGDDPVTPPRHAARVAQALGPRARHLIIPHAGHGTVAIGCMRDVVFRFIDNDDEAAALAALASDAQCALQGPRPLAFALPRPPGAARPPSLPASAPAKQRLPDPSRYSKADR